MLRYKVYFKNKTCLKFKSILYQKTKGFFVECGANDGETLSSTLFMERFFKWKGLLIEPNPNSFFKLLSRNRKAYALPICLSPDPYPVLVSSLFKIMY